MLVVDGLQVAVRARVGLTVAQGVCGRVFGCERVMRGHDAAAVDQVCGIVE